MTASSGNTDKGGPISPEKYILTKARKLPLWKCYINESWHEMGKGSLIVSRKHLNGNITCGFYLIDLFCVGVKDSFYLFNISEKEFEDVLDEMSEKEDLLELKYPLAHNIIYGSVDFAEEFKFKPHKSFQLTRHILEDDTEGIEFIDVPFGIDDKPAVVVSEENPMLNIIKHLEKVVGKDNYIVLNEEEFLREHDSMKDIVVSKERSNSDFEMKEDTSNEEEYEDESLLGDYQDYSNEELFMEIDELVEEEIAEAIGPIHELFLRLQEDEKFETLYEKLSQIYDEIVVVNDFNYPGLNFLPENQLERFYDLSELTEDNPEDAVLTIRKALNEYPNPVFEHLLVSAYGYLGKHDEATSILKQALDKYSNDFMLRVGYGFILLMNDQFDQLKMFMSGFDLKKVVPDRKIFHITEIGRFLCLACSYYALTNQLLVATVYQKILDEFSDIPEGTYYQKLTTFNILCPMQWEYIRQNYDK